MNDKKPIIAVAATAIRNFIGKSIAGRGVFSSYFLEFDQFKIQSLELCRILNFIIFIIF